ncbi:MAG: DDE-type integrase/transposase/recombinase [Christensenellaceae bacterium]
MYKFSAKEKLYALKALKNAEIYVVCRRYKISRVTLWHWRKQYDGTLESLQPKFSRKHIKMPNEQSDEEKTAINNLIKRNPDIGLNELYGKLCKNYGYKRNYVTLYRYLRKSNILIIKKRKPYKPKPYITPIDIGEKWQLDVKFVPRECYSGVVYEKTYQYTVIDEASRKRYIRAYKEQSSFSTVDFVMRAFRFFGYKPKIIQTDNGQEFTFLKGETKDGRIHLFDKLCLKLGIEHKLIRPRTPRHNGKVERSHRTDNERFYKYLRYYDFNDLQTQMSRYLTRSNNIPSRVLRSRFNKNRWLSPNEKERELCAEII